MGCLKGTLAGQSVRWVSAAKTRNSRPSSRIPDVARGPLR